MSLDRYRDVDPRNYIPFMRCPTFTVGDSIASSIDIDPSFYNFSLCECESGYYFDPSKRMCEENVGFVRVGLVSAQRFMLLPGFYYLGTVHGTGDIPTTPKGALPDLKRIIKCTIASACNPRGTIDYECGRGIDEASVMCSGCDDGFFMGPTGAECNECTTSHKVVMPLLAIIPHKLCRMERMQELPQNRFYLPESEACVHAKGTSGRGQDT